MSSSRLAAMPYYGGKFYHLPFILPRLLYTGCYVEPFSGGASVLLNRRVEKIEVLNDLNSDVVNFFRVLRDYPDELLYRLHYTPYSREEFQNAKAVLGDGDIDDPVEQARLWYFHQSASSVGVASLSSTMQVHKSLNVGSPTPRTFANRASLHASVSSTRLGVIAERLRGVMIEHMDALDVIKKYDAPTTFFYCDPPYVHSTRKATSVYVYEQDDTWHKSLSEILHSVKGRAAISGYSSRLYDSLYADWYRCEHVSNPSRSSTFGFNVASKSTKGAERVEVLWTNYPVQLDALSEVLGV